MNEQSIAYEVPLHERLETVPHNARLIIEDENGLGTTYIPIGREAKLAASELRRLHEVNQELVEALEDVTAHLVGAHELIQNGGEKAAPSNTMFMQMLKDYEKAIDTGRTALVKAKGETK
jgi:hypothetical protein